MKPLSLVFVPGFNINIIKCHRAESIDESTCQAAIRNQWHIKVNRSTPNFITISQFMHRQVLLNINDQINLSLVQQIQSLWLLSLFRWPVNPRIGYTILFEELTGATSGIEFIAMCNQLFGSIKHI